VIIKTEECDHGTRMPLVRSKGNMYILSNQEA